MEPKTEPRRFWNGYKCMLVVFYTILLTLPVSSKQDVCVVRGKIYTHLDWYGYILQKTFKHNTSLIQYQISYPVSECCANLLIYYDDQMRDLKTGMTCQEREKILPESNNQVIPLTTNNGTIGCKIWNEGGSGPMYVCIGERTFKSTHPKTWYVAVSRCGSTKPLTMNYYFNVSGYYGSCEEDPLADTFIPPKQESDDTKNLHIAIAMGVIAGIAIIVAVIFILLYVISRRQNNQKPKTSGSVTSSQATMTQDIFYVNPSLSDREHSDSQYSRSSSENYYEVIPDRRSYESINTQLALAGHGGRSLAMGTIPRDHRAARIPSYIFEDIPPPPYQPPQLQAHQGNIVHQSQNSGGSGHHSQGSGSGHPLLGNNGNSPQSTAQQIPMTSRMLAPSSHANGPLHSGSQTMTAGIQLQNTGRPLMTSGNYPHLPMTSLTGATPSSGNGGIATSAAGSGITHSAAQAGKQQNTGHPLHQNGGQMQNGGLNHGTTGRTPLHNTNHAKLLHHAYRIQQFETTA